MRRLLIVFVGGLVAACAAAGGYVHDEYTARGVQPVSVLVPLPTGGDATWLVSERRDADKLLVSLPQGSSSEQLTLQDYEQVASQFLSNTDRAHCILQPGQQPALGNYEFKYECAVQAASVAPTKLQTPSIPTKRTPSTISSGGSKTVSVRGYYRKDGTYVRPHTRSAPRR